MGKRIRLKFRCLLFTMGWMGGGGETVTPVWIVVVLVGRRVEKFIIFCENH